MVFVSAYTGAPHNRGLVTHETLSDALRRIVRAGVQCVIRGGVSGATEARVTKALLHYHFSGRSQIVSDMVNHLGRRLIGRDWPSAQGNGSPVDSLWRWLHQELESGELRALLALARSAR